MAVTWLVKKITSLPEKSLIAIFIFFLRTKTTEVVFFSVGIEQPQNDFVTHFLSLSFVVALNITFVSRQICACAVLFIMQQSSLSKPVGDCGLFHTALHCQDPLADLSKSCSSHAASCDEWFLSASHPSLPLNSDCHCKCMDSLMPSLYAAALFPSLTARSIALT